MDSKIATRIITIDPRELKLLELNARYMKYEEYSRLVENVRNDGKLTSVPFACLDGDGKYLVLSGNHRVMASIDAELPEISVMVTDDELSQDKRIAIQLSHNSISGQDDASILKELYEAIDDVELKAYSGLDDETLELLGKIQPISISEANLKFQVVSITFLPDELEHAKEVFDEAMELAKGDEKWVARFSEYDKWLDSLEAAGTSHDVKNVATSLMIVLDTFHRNITSLTELYKDKDIKRKTVPVYPLLGVSEIDVQAARTIGKAIDRMVSKEEVDSRSRYKALEILAQRYLEDK